MEPDDADAGRTVDELPEIVLKEIAVELDQPPSFLYRDLAAKYDCFSAADINTFSIYAGPALNHSAARYMFKELGVRGQHELWRLIGNLEAIQCLSLVRKLKHWVATYLRRPSPDGRLRVFIASAPRSSKDQAYILKLKDLLEKDGQFSVFQCLQFRISEPEREATLQQLERKFLQKADVIIFCLFDGLQSYLTGPVSSTPEILEIQQRIQSIEKYLLGQRARHGFNLAVVRFYKIESGMVPGWLLEETHQFDMSSEESGLVNYLQQLHRHAHRVG